MAKKVAADKGLEVEFILSGAESIPLPDNHVDTVLVTYTMCTIPDALSANKEMRRVLKPGGKLIFCEHGLAPDGGVAKWQVRIDPYSGRSIFDLLHALLRLDSGHCITPAVSLVPTPLVVLSSTRRLYVQNY